MSSVVKVPAAEIPAPLYCQLQVSAACASGSCTNRKAAANSVSSFVLLGIASPVAPARNCVFPLTFRPGLGGSAALTSVDCGCRPFYFIRWRDASLPDLGLSLYSAPFRPEKRGPRMSPAPLDVVGVGNPIVDVIAHADERFLATENLAKGAMTLIDAERAQALYA